MEYRISKETCQKQCDGKVCCICGSNLVPFDTIDNSRKPTFWPGCEQCMRFEYGTTKEVFQKAQELHEDFDHVSMHDLCLIVARLTRTMLGERNGC